MTLVVVGFLDAEQNDAEHKEHRFESVFSFECHLGGRMSEWGQRVTVYMNDRSVVRLNNVTFVSGSR